MNERLTIELEPHVMAWLRTQAAELAQVIAEGQGGEGEAKLVTPAFVASALVSSEYVQWTGTSPTEKGDL